MHWHHSATSRATYDVVLPNFFKTEVKYDTLKKSLEEMNTALEKAPFLAGTDKPTIADLFILPEIDQLGEGVFGGFDISPYPKVVEWVSNMGKAMPTAYAGHMEKIKAAVKAFG